MKYYGIHKDNVEIVKQDPLTIINPITGVECEPIMDDGDSGRWDMFPFRIFDSEGGHIDGYRKPILVAVYVDGVGVNVEILMAPLYASVERVITDPTFGVLD